jgi:predicted  nucleic acid-binding Zn-ribbon protein
LDEFSAEVAEANAKLERLEEKLRDIQTEKAETMASIDASQRTLHIQKNSTQAEALRLKGTLSSVQRRSSTQNSLLTRIHARQTNSPR